MTNPIQILLNHARWAKGDLGAYTLEIISRPAGTERISAARVKHVQGGGITIWPTSWPECDAEDTTYIPFHRIVAIYDVGEQLVYQKGAKIVEVGKR